MSVTLFIDAGLSKIIIMRTTTYCMCACLYNIQVARHVYFGYLGYDVWELYNWVMGYSTSTYSYVHTVRTIL